MMPSTSLNGIDQSRRLVTLLFIAAALALRMYHLEAQSLWNDEMFSLDVARQSLADIQPVLVANYHHPPLFFYLAHLSIQWFGATAWALRLPSAIAGALTVGLVFSATDQISSRLSGLAAGAFCLLSPFHLAYSQEGRPYALAALLALLSCVSFLFLLRDGSIGRKVGYVLSTLALLYTHHWGIFVLATQCLLVIAWHRRELWKQLRYFELVAIIVILYIPEFLALRRQTLESAPIQWFWSTPPSPQELYRLATAFSGTYFNMASSVFELPVVLQILAALALIYLLTLPLREFWKHRGSHPIHLITLCLGGTLLIPFVISFIKPEIFLWYRYTVIVFPLLCVTIGGALHASRMGRNTIVAAVCIGIALVAGIIGDSTYYSWEKSNAKEVAAFVEQVTNDGVPVVIRPKEFAPLLNYYYKGKATQYDEAYLESPLGKIVDTIPTFAYVSLDVPNLIRNYMNGHFVKLNERHFPGKAHMGILVDVYKQPPDTDSTQSE
ncbi:MAG TPA: glycosyltransferase family 39 protein [Bacteroidota bacterium]|nr:glycosyltransferase family 39 protein [Bacteroidota bacterium]